MHQTIGLPAGYIRLLGNRLSD